MSAPEPSFTVGIEEEYLLVDLETRNLAADPPPALMAACEAALPEQVSPEFLRCQIEIGTPVCATLVQARQELAHLRSTIGLIANRFGLAPIAASTHPFAQWSKQHHTDQKRYDVLAKDMQVVVRRLLICGMHVHVGIEDEALRMDLFAQLTYFLPHLLALSTSSPFWQGTNTGLKSYRLSVFRELPRSGLPFSFGGPDEYQRNVAVLIDAGLIEDASKIWWDLRPSARFPTLEMRVTDVCSCLSDAIAIAALLRCLARMLWRLRGANQRWRAYSSFLIEENRWLAQRFGATGKLLDFGKGTLVPFAELIDELIELVREDAEFFDCVAQVEHARTIARSGTSADRQLAAYQKARAGGKDHQEALCRVVDLLIAETVGIG